jgi:hypothetical protein
MTTLNYESSALTIELQARRGAATDLFCAAGGHTPSQFTRLPKQGRSSGGSCGEDFAGGGVDAGLPLGMLVRGGDLFLK